MDELDEMFKTSPEAKEAFEKGKRFKLFTEGEVIHIKGEPFLLQCIRGDSLIFVSKKLADSLRPIR